MSKLSNIKNKMNNVKESINYNELSLLAYTSPRINESSRADIQRAVANNKKLFRRLQAEYLFEKIQQLRGVNHE